MKHIDFWIEANFQPGDRVVKSGSDSVYTIHAVYVEGVMAYPPTMDAQSVEYAITPANGGGQTLYSIPEVSLSPESGTIEPIQVQFESIPIAFSRGDKVLLGDPTCAEWGICTVRAVKVRGGLVGDRHLSAIHYIVQDQQDELRIAQRGALYPLAAKDTLLEQLKGIRDEVRAGQREADRQTRRTLNEAIRFLGKISTKEVDE